jgi:hypothetical protein
VLIRQIREVQRHLLREPAIRARYRWRTPGVGSSRSGRRGR